MAVEQTQPRRRFLAAQLTAPLGGFIATEAGSAGLLLAATVVALVWANSPWSDAYESLWETEGVVRIGAHELALDLGHWIDDAPMALFFLVVGLEVRRELSIGELTERRRVVVPAIAAMCGIPLPVVLFF